MKWIHGIFLIDRDRETRQKPEGLSMKIKKRSDLLCVVSFCLAMLFHSSPVKAQDAARPVVFQGALLIDGTGRAPVQNSVVVVEGGKIVAVGAAGSVQIPKGAEVRDLHGKSIMPLLVPLIGHVGLTAKVGDSSQCLCYSEEIIRSELQLNLAYGIGVYVSLGQDQDLIYKLREDSRAGNLPGSRLYTAGRGLGVKDAYPGPVYANGVDQYRPVTPEEGRADMRELATHHPDFVKIWIDDNYGSIPKMQPAMYRALIDEAHKQHLRVIAHEYALEDAKGLVDAGVDGFAHSIRDKPVDEELIKAMKAHGTFLIPSAAREESKVVYQDGPKYLDDPFFQAGLDVGVLETLRSPAFKAEARNNPYYIRNEKALKLGFELAKKNLKTLYDAGVKISFGSDSGFTAQTFRFEGYHEHRELQIMVEAGLTPMQAITAATGTSAGILGGAKVEFGTLEAGKLADFMVLDASPLENIYNTEKISEVWQSGKAVRPITAGKRH
jgi:imidazolonepropionase-like amidohydrolase